MHCWGHFLHLGGHFWSDFRFLTPLWGCGGLILGVEKRFGAQHVAQEPPKRRHPRNPLTFWGHFWCMRVTWGDFGFTLGPLWSYRRRFALLMHIISPCVRSKRVHKRETNNLPTFFACRDGPEDAKSTNKYPSRVNFAALWSYFGVAFDIWG